jgi:hypothetical protein
LRAAAERVIVSRTALSHRSECQVVRERNARWLALSHGRDGFVGCGTVASGPRDASLAVVQSGTGGAWSGFTESVLGVVVVLAVLAASCTSRQAVRSDCTFERPGLVALLAEMDAGAQDAPPVQDAIPDPIAQCSAEQRSVAAPSRARVEFRRQCDGGADQCFTVLSVGPEGLTPVELDAITKQVEDVDTQPVLSITRRYDEVIVWTGAVCGDLCGSGREYRLRKTSGTWVIICRTSWVS